MNIIFFDDDQETLTAYRSLMKNQGLAANCFYFSDVSRLLVHLVRRNTPTLYFLDLIGENNQNVGFRIAEEIRTHSQQSMIVFITAYPNQIVYNSRQKLGAVNCIYKSSKVWRQEVILTVKYALGKLGKAALHYDIGDREIHRITVEQIVFAETLKRQNKIKINMTNGQYIVRDTLKSLGEKIKEYPFLFRCHSSFFANVGQIKSIDKSQRVIVFSDDSSCYVSPLKTKELIARWQMHG